MQDIDSINERFARELNASQLKAVTYIDGPSLVIAGAGSGKTRVLTYKIAYLLELGLEPWRILALTFTNKAAREMNERIGRICEGRDMRGLWSGTFHSLFARLLRIEHDAAGLPADYSIYDAADAKSLIKAIVKELGLDDKKYKASTIAARISEAKNHIILPDAYNRDASIARRDYTDGIEQTGKIYTIYQARLAKAGALDFDDLLLQTYLLLSGNEEVRTRYRQRFGYILVDEYQDTNMLQHHILATLTEAGSRICVVGDDAQSIYGFRGADINNILQFTRQYPTARLIKLECNYRSTQTIVEAANCIIRRNRGQIPKRVFSAGEKGRPICLFSAYSDKEEASKVAAQILKLHNREGIGFSEIALLYRTNAQSRSLEETLKAAAIPYRIYGGLSFYQRKEIKDVLGYCRLVANLNDEEAFRRIVNYPARGIGSTTLAKLQYAAGASGVSLWQVALNPEACGASLGTAARKKLAAFCELILSFRESMKSRGAYDLVIEIMRRSGVGADINADHSAESLARRQNVEELLNAIRAAEMEALEETGETFLPLQQYLANVSLLTDADKDDDSLPHVTLMTIHAAKGLEFDAVFVTGMEEDLFPGPNAALFPKEMEEERRLFYVAVTRAKRFCFLSYAKSRFRYGRIDSPRPSPFLKEIDKQFVERLDRPSPFDTARGGERTGGLAGANRGFAAPEHDIFDRKRESFGAGRNVRGGNGEDYARSDRFIPPGEARRDVTIHPAGATATGGATAGGGSAPASSAGGLNIGARISHERFGEGTIAAIEGSGENQKVRVDFDNVGTKNLLVKFAKFKLV